LLPSDRYIAELLELTDEQYEVWRDELRRRAQQGPQPAVVAGLDPVSILVSVVISVGLSLIAAALAPRPRTPRPALLEARQRTGQGQTSLQTFAPRSGFDAVQDVAARGAPIPIVYARRENLDGRLYGGIRVNTPLLWSQIWSLGGSQLLRAIFMLSEGEIDSVQSLGFAIGSNSISAYDLLSVGANQSSSRLTIYYKPDGGRISSADRIAGRSAGNDFANAQNDGAADVFQLRSVGNAYAADFSASSKPSNSTTFGIYSLIGNNLGFKLNPSVRPVVNANLKPVGKKGDAIVVCNIDNIATVQRQKFNAYFSSRSGITTGAFTVGQSFTYVLDRTSDYSTEFSSGVPTTGTWVSGKELNDETPIYDASGNKLNIDWLSFLTVATASVNTTSGTATAESTFNVDSALPSLTNAVNGQYRIEYWITLKNTTIDAELFAPFDIIITKSGIGSVTQVKNVDGVVTDVSFNPSGAGTITEFLLEVAEDSGAPQTLTSPNRLRSDVGFNFEQLGAYVETASDVGSSVASRQKTWDDAIVVGDVYKIGSALAVCTERSPNNQIFLSDSDQGIAGSGQSINAQFTVVRSGTAGTVSLVDLQKPGTDTVTRRNATGGAHLFKVALATFSTSSECKVVEIGIRSTLGQRINGLCDFRNSLSLAQSDGRACLFREGDRIKRGATLIVDQYQSGQVTVSEERYSFFRISYRQAGTEDAFSQLSPCYGTRGMTQQPSFSYVRLEMPSTGKWEFRFEPLSGWEIRNNVAAGDLVILDAKLSSVVSNTSGTVKWYANGQTVLRNKDQFTINSTLRSGGMGFTLVDEDNYLDAWGKLAESFVYDNAQSSAQQGPEHEIVYVNEIAVNTKAPEYKGIALVGVNIRSSVEWSQFSQFSAYVTGGVRIRRLLNNLTAGPSHLFPDIVLDRFTNPKYGPGRISDDLIDLEAFHEAAQWCQDRRYFYDGAVLPGSESPRQWTADTAASMLLDFREVNGRYQLAPFITFGTVAPRALFTAGNIANGSFQFETVPPDERQPIQVSVKWRQERSDVDPLGPGLFSSEREVLVREAGGLSTDQSPIEPIDVSDFCTNEQHAIDIAKFRLRMRRYRDHSVKFRTTYDGLEGICTSLSPGDYIRVALDTTSYDQFTNGAVTATGALVSTQPLADGSYDIISWDGGKKAPTENTLIVRGQQASPVGIIFTLRPSNAQVRTYQVNRITPSEDGAFEIEAAHMPVNSSSQLEVVADWNRADAWVIER